MKPARSALFCFVVFLAGSGAFAQDSFDSDNDGFDDNSDNCTLTANPLQRDTDADGYGNFCDADFNNDNTINFIDLSIIKPRFFTNDSDTDLNGDNVVNIIDLGILKSKFLDSPGPTGTHPTVENCNCTFSSHCPGGNFCDYGPGSFTTEDICFFRTPTPPNGSGTGCSTEHEGFWDTTVCDGFCTAFDQGSSIGVESVDVVIASVELWADALLGPSIIGGGPVDKSMAQAAKDLAYVGNNAAIILGRQVSDLLEMASGKGFSDYFNDYEIDAALPGKFVDLQNDNCRISSARLTIKALQSEIRQSGSGTNHVLRIADHCESEIWTGLFAPRCNSGPDALQCFSAVVAELAVFLTTPKQAMPDPAISVFDGLR